MISKISNVMEALPCKLLKNLTLRTLVNQETLQKPHCRIDQNWITSMYVEIV